MSYHNLYELQNLSSTIDIEHIKNWLIKYKNEFHNTINSNTCKKWSKWLNTNEKPFPCVCSSREQDCIFIEAYYELEKIAELHKKEDNFKSIVQEYKSIVNNKNAVSEWIEKYKDFEVELYFYSEINISLQSEPYKSLRIALNESEFKNLLEFQKIFSELQYNQNQ